MPCDFTCHIERIIFVCMYIHIFICMHTYAYILIYTLDVLMFTCMCVFACAHTCSWGFVSKTNQNTCACQHHGHGHGHGQFIWMIKNSDGPASDLVPHMNECIHIHLHMCICMCTHMLLKIFSKTKNNTCACKHVCMHVFVSVLFSTLCPRHTRV